MLPLRGAPATKQSRPETMAKTRLGRERLFAEIAVSRLIKAAPGKYCPEANFKNADKKDEFTSSAHAGDGGKGRIATSRRLKAVQATGHLAAARRNDVYYGRRCVAPSLKEAAPAGTGLFYKLFWGIILWLNLEDLAGLALLGHAELG